jgi:flavoprotein hydroxylase
MGMCSGIRDAANLTWKLDLVLSGHAPETLLDTYTTERRQHLHYAIQASMYLGQIICQSDPAAAAERDARMFAEFRNGGNPVTGLLLQPQNLTGGLLMCDADGAPLAPAGQLSRQGKVRFRGRTGLFDQAAGAGFTLLGTEDHHSVLDETSLAWCQQAGVRLLKVTGDLTANGPADVADLDGVYLSHLAKPGQMALLIRPDYYVFGGAAHPDEVPRLVGALRKGLTGQTAALQPS